MNEERRLLQEQLYNSLKLMIHWTLACQKEYEGLRANYSPKSWAKEICTVHFQVSRQSGHTRMVINLVNEGIFQNPLIVVPNDSLEKHYRNEIIKRAEIAVVSPNYRSRISFDTNAVIFDPAYVISNKRIEELIECYCKRAHKVPFIFLFME